MQTYIGKNTELNGLYPTDKSNLKEKSKKKGGGEVSIQQHQGWLIFLFSNQMQIRIGNTLQEKKKRYTPSRQAVKKYLTIITL